MKIVSFASIVLPGAFASFPEELYRFDTTGGRCGGDYKVNAISSADECKVALAAEGTDTSAFKPIAYGNWENGCFKNIHGTWYNTGFDQSKRQQAEANSKNSQTQWLCKKSSQPEPLYRFDISGGRCASPSYDVAGITSAAECKNALGYELADKGVDAFQFKAIAYPDWENGCFTNTHGSWYNTGFDQSKRQIAEANSKNTQTEWLCKHKPLPPTPPTPLPEPVFESEKCDPKECDNWTCKSWCKCFKAHPEIIEIFEGPNPSASEQAIRDSCPSDGQDDCDCTEFHFGNAKKEVAGGQSQPDPEEGPEYEWDRTQCGYDVHDQESCEKHDCLWGPLSHGSSNPWCYNKFRNKCAVNGDARRNCDHVHLDHWRDDGHKRWQCENAGCCWQPSDVSGRPWCFHSSA